VPEEEEETSQHDGKIISLVAGAYVE